jgi:hypothetical protein
LGVSVISFGVFLTFFFLPPFFFFVCFFLCIFFVSSTVNLFSYYSIVCGALKSTTSVSMVSRSSSRSSTMPCISVSLCLIFSASYSYCSSSASGWCDFSSSISESAGYIGKGI